MNYFYKILFIGLLLNIGIPTSSQKCGFNDYLKQTETNSNNRKLREATDLQIKDFITNNSSGITSIRTEIIIPVVIHVVWNKPDENIDLEKIQSQIEILNNDFNAQNSDISLVPDEFKNSIGNAGIRFCLAVESPDGVFSTGILRTHTIIEQIGVKEELFFSHLGGSDAWDTDRYLNVWIANTGEHITGFGTYPQQTESEKTGVVIHSKYFGKNNSTRYNLGRVAVHEVGHYLGLYHLWGGCDTDDEVEDTPYQFRYYDGCPIHPQESCNSNDMFMNFMDYVDDPCMLMFSQGQKERMLATIELFRPQFLNSDIKCYKSQDVSSKLSFNVFPNPTQNQITINFQQNILQVKTLSIFNSIGQLCKSENILISKKNIIDLSRFNSGIYFFKIEDNVQKVVIVK